MARSHLLLVLLFMVVWTGEIHPDEAFTREGVARIESVLQQAVAERRVPAAVAMLARDSRLEWVETAGEMAPGIPMRSDAILPLSSVGKLFTAIAVMILYEQGALAPDDPVSRFIAEFAKVRVRIVEPAGRLKLVAPERPVSLFHLLTHTGGLTVDGAEFWAAWDRNADKTTTTQLALELAALPLQSQPGNRFNYGATGASYEVLGAVIEIVSGQTLEQFMTQNIFVPLGLDDTCFYAPTEKSNRLPEIYRKVGGELQLERAFGQDYSRSTFFHGGGGVNSTPRDLLKLGRLLLEGGSVDGVRILQKETVAMMMSDQLGERAPEQWKSKGLSWGFGAAIEHSLPVAGGSLKKFGGSGGGIARFWVDPQQQVIAYFNAPLAPPGDEALLSQFEDLVSATLSP